jgi:hypothetical protein
MNILYLNIALAAVLFYFVWIVGKQKNIRILLLLVLAIAALPDITQLIDRREAVTFTAIILLLATLLSFAKAPLSAENTVVRVVSRLLTASLILTTILAALAVYQTQYPIYYYDQVQGIILFLFLGIALLVIGRSRE